MTAPARHHTVEICRAVDLADEPRVAFSRIRVIQAVDVGQQDQCVGAHQMRDQGGQPVVVTEPDFIGGHGVVLVDDRDRVQRPQPVQRALGIGVLYPHGDVVGGQQNLADRAVIAGERRAPRVHECHLPDAGRRLLGGQIGGTLGEPQRFDACGDRTQNGQPGGVEHP